MIEPFVDWTWCAARRDRILIADVRAGEGAFERFEAGHLAGAVFVDLDVDCSGSASEATGRHPLPDPTIFAATLGRLGIDGSRPVVAVDEHDGVFAARLAWMLRTLRMDAAVLDGGAAATGEMLETGPDAPETVHVEPRAWPAEAIASIDEVAAGAAVVVDARPRARFEGAPDPLDPRPGHIPGAVSAPCREHLDGDGRIAAPSALAAAFAEAGVDSAEGVISSCGSGVTACHNLLAMERAGLGRGRLYPGSWSQWAADPARPVELGRGAAR